MTARSERGYVIRGLNDTDTLFQAKGPVDAGHARDLINNANHLVDESTQVVANLPGPFMTHPDAWNTFRPSFVPRLMFPLPIREDGSSVRLAVSMRVRVMFASTVTIRFGIQPWRNGQVMPLGTFSSAVVSTSSTSGVMLSTTAPLYMPSVMVGAASRSAASNRLEDQFVTQDANLNPANVPCIMAAFDLFSSITVDKVEAEITSLYIREYIG